MRLDPIETTVATRLIFFIQNFRGFYKIKQRDFSRSKHCIASSRQTSINAHEINESVYIFKSTTALNAHESNESVSIFTTIKLSEVF